MLPILEVPMRRFAWHMVAFLTGTLIVLLLASIGRAQEDPMSQTGCYRQRDEYGYIRLICPGGRYPDTLPPGRGRNPYIEPYDYSRCPAPEVACRVGDQVCCRYWMRRR